MILVYYCMGLIFVVLMLIAKIGEEFRQAKKHEQTRSQVCQTHLKEENEREQ